MSNLNKSLFLFIIVAALGNYFPQSLFGQSTFVSAENMLEIEDDIFGESYAYVSGRTIVSEQVITDGADVYYKAGKFIKLNPGFKVQKNCHFRARILNNDVSLKSEVENEALQSNAIRVFPNVSSGLVNVQIQSKANDGQNSLKVYNMSGVLVHSAKQIPEETTIDLSDCPQGMYLLKVDVNNNNSFLEKIMIQ